MSKYPFFKMSFGIGSTNEERIEACNLYQKAFNAKKTGESVPPDGCDIHIDIEINGFPILLGPGGKVSKDRDGLDIGIVCELHYDNENKLRKAYEALIQAGQNYSLEGPFPWATLLALVTDKFGIGWALYYHEKKN
jgi:uncharacterized glyoxalase superfamily protein PhnB